MTPFPCCGESNAFLRNAKAWQPEQWWEQTCPDCAGKWRFIRKGFRLTHWPLHRFTVEFMIDRTQPIDPWAMAVQMAQELEAG